MATGNYQFSSWMDDESSTTMENSFFLPDTHSAKYSFSTMHYNRRAHPGSVWVYHSSDHYLCGFSAKRYRLCFDILSALWTLQRMWIYQLLHRKLSGPCLHDHRQGESSEPGCLSKAISWRWRKASWISHKLDKIYRMNKMLGFCPSAQSWLDFLNF